MTRNRLARPSTSEDRGRPEPHPLAGLPAEVLADHRDVLALMIHPAYATLEQVADRFGELVDGERPGLPPAAGAALIAEVWTARLQEQQRWSGPADADRLRAAFGQLTAEAVVARECLGWTVREGVGLLTEPMTGSRGWVVFSEEDTHELVDEPGELRLTFGAWRHADPTPVGHQIASTLVRHGLQVTWPGDPRVPIRLTGLRWRRRLPPSDLDPDPDPDPDPAVL